MRLVTTLLFGLAAALVGSVAWILVAHYLNYELGLIAWGIGLLAGVGARYGAKEWMGKGPGAIAVVAALLAIVVGKVGGVVALVGAGPAITSDADAIPWVADAITVEREHRGEAVAWPPGMSRDVAWQEADYPADVWAEAAARWRAYSDEERERFRKTPYLIDRMWVKSLVANEVAAEWEESGRTVDWPGHTPASGVSGPSDYPQDVWAEAERRWESMTPPERRAVEDEAAKSVDGLLIRGQIVALALLASLSLWDLLWVGLAGMSAFRLGHGTESPGATLETPA